MTTLNKRKSHSINKQGKWTYDYRQPDTIDRKHTAYPSEFIYKICSFGGGAVAQARIHPAGYLPNAKHYRIGQEMS